MTLVIKETVNRYHTVIIDSDEIDPDELLIRAKEYGQMYHQGACESFEDALYDMGKKFGFDYEVKQDDSGCTTETVEIEDIKE